MDLYLTFRRFLEERGCAREFEEAFGSQLPGYRLDAVLWDIYGSQTVYDDIDLIEDAVEGICDEEKVTWYTNVSRIKRKITDMLGKRAAEQYIIRRGPDSLYRIGAILSK